MEWPVAPSSPRASVSPRATPSLSNLQSELSRKNLLKSRLTQWKKHSTSVGSGGLSPTWKLLYVINVYYNEIDFYSSFILFPLSFICEVNNVLIIC